MVVCLVRGADLHMAQRIPLPLTVSCSSNIQIGFTFLVLAHLGSPGQRAVKRMCVCAYVCVRACMRAFALCKSACSSATPTSSTMLINNYSHSYQFRTVFQNLIFEKMIFIRSDIRVC